VKGGAPPPYLPRRTTAAECAATVTLAVECPNPPPPQAVKGGQCLLSVAD